MNQTSLPRIYLVLFATIVIWGLSWPTGKVVLDYIPPFWFAAIRLFMAALFVIALTLFLGRFRLPTRKDFPLIAAIGLFHLAAYTIFLHMRLMK